MKPICLFLCGDVMTGRGIDQVLPYPADPVLYEPYVRDAREYVELAEVAHGAIPRPVDFGYIWGDALEELERAGTDARIINLETSITCAEEPWPKGIHYRMNPRNIDCLTAARIDCCCLANNHLLDWGSQGLMETIRTLDRVGVAHAGAGSNGDEASVPAVLELADQERLFVLAAGSTSSGIPPEWAATTDRPGVHLLNDLSQNTASRLAGAIQRLKRPGDVALVSIHWGANWGYEIPEAQIHFAHRLIDEGVDLIHGHSSHHVKAIEVYHQRLILYGCGDFLTDYEGITGYEEFRGDLAVMYLVKLEPRQGRLLELRLVPFQSQRFRLNRVSAMDLRWLADLMNTLGREFSAQVRLEDDNSMKLEWQVRL